MCVADGPQAVEYGLRASLVQRVFVDPVGSDRFAELVEEALRAGIEVVDIDEPTMAGLTETQSPQGIVGIVEIPAQTVDVWSARPRNVLLLEESQDPGNVGMIMRTADAAGVDVVALGPGSADPFSAKCIRASAGSAFGVPVVTAVNVPELIRAAREQGLVIRGTSGQATQRLYEPGGPDLSRPTMWVFGNEARGLTPEVARQCDELVAIPMFGGSESLNVGVAAALCMYATALAQRGSHLG